MRFFIDNCLPPRLAAALNALDEDREIVALRQKFAASTKDAEWLGVLGSEGDWVVVSGDPRITRGKHERAAWLQSGLTAFFLEPGWTNIGLWLQASKLVRWWPLIVDQSQRIQSGAGFMVPVNGSKLRQVPR